MDLDIYTVLIIVGIVIGAAAVLSLLIYGIMVIKRKVTKKEVTEIGTDKSDFAKQLMDEYHQERINNGQ